MMSHLLYARYLWWPRICSSNLSYMQPVCSARDCFGTQAWLCLVAQGATGPAPLADFWLLLQAERSISDIPLCRAAVARPWSGHFPEAGRFMSDILFLLLSLLSLGRYCWGRSTTPLLTGGPLVSSCMRCSSANPLSTAKMKRSFSSPSVWTTPSTLVGWTRMQRTFW